MRGGAQGGSRPAAAEGAEGVREWRPRGGLPAAVPGSVFCVNPVWASNKAHFSQSHSISGQGACSSH